MKEKVAAAMADKYWMDILIRHESHPMVARLVPEASPPQTSCTLTAPPDPCPWPADSADRHVQSAHTQVVIERSQGNGLIKRKGTGCGPAPRCTRLLTIDFVFLASLTLRLPCP